MQTSSGLVQQSFPPSIPTQSSSAHKPPPHHTDPAYDNNVENNYCRTWQLRNKTSNNTFQPSNRCSLPLPATPFSYQQQMEQSNNLHQFHQSYNEHVYESPIFEQQHYFGGSQATNESSQYFEIEQDTFPTNTLAIPTMGCDVMFDQDGANFHGHTQP